MTSPATPGAARMEAALNLQAMASAAITPVNAV